MTLHIDRITIHFHHDGESGSLHALVETMASTQDERRANKLMVNPIYVDVANPPTIDNILTAVNEALVRLEETGWRWRVWQGLTRGREGLARRRRLALEVASYEDQVKEGGG